MGEVFLVYLFVCAFVPLLMFFFLFFFFSSSSYYYIV